MILFTLVKNQLDSICRFFTNFFRLGGCGTIPQMLLTINSLSKTCNTKCMWIYMCCKINEHLMNNVWIVFCYHSPLISYDKVVYYKHHLEFKEWLSTGSSTWSSVLFKDYLYSVYSYRIKGYNLALHGFVVNGLNFTLLELGFLTGTACPHACRFRHPGCIKFLKKRLHSGYQSKWNSTDTLNVYRISTNLKLSPPPKLSISRWHLNPHLDIRSSHLVDSPTVREGRVRQYLIKYAMISCKCIQKIAKIFRKTLEKLGVVAILQALWSLRYCL